MMKNLSNVYLSVAIINFLCAGALIFLTSDNIFKFFSFIFLANFIFNMNLATKAKKQKVPTSFKLQHKKF